MSNLKAVIIGIVFVILFGSVLFPVDAEATNGSINNTSVLTADDMSEGYALISTRGMYLQSGLSRISKAGEGKVTVTGITFAQQRVEEVSVTVELQKLEGGNWQTYEMWTETAKDDISIEFVKTLDVESGTYRVKSLHFANTDASSSFTRALYIS